MVLNSSGNAPWATVAMGQITVPLDAGQVLVLTMNNTWNTSAWIQSTWYWYNSIAVV